MRAVKSAHDWRVKAGGTRPATRREARGNGPQARAGAGAASQPEAAVRNVPEHLAARSRRQRDSEELARRDWIGQTRSPRRCSSISHAMSTDLVRCLRGDHFHERKRFNPCQPWHVLPSVGCCQSTIEE